ncbi:hypothetical protein PAL_GLEAN10025780 [Pteropus alecto]|uniref:Uncharacterized protein n=1 Tax=Pteropus alecto TaxID=9402 RepID=L5K218_PTEAL|nr:hypothetical protein PAL_GLEAN10025780 [Pteropus alecto]
MRSTGKQCTQLQRPPPLPPRPLGPILRPSLRSSDGSGAQEAGLSATMPEVPPASC